MLTEVSPIFMDLTLEDQINELLTFLKQFDKLSTTGTESGVVDAAKDETKSKWGKGVPRKSNEQNVTEILDIFEAIFVELNEADLECVLNNIVSILVTVDPELNSPFYTQFTSKLMVASKTYPYFRTIFLRVLWLMFQSLDDRKKLRCVVYTSILDLSLMVDRFNQIYKGIENFQNMFENIDDRCPEMHALYRKLYGILMKLGQGDQASKIMTNLLSTYTDETAKEAREDAIMCILSAISDPNTFLLEPLLNLKPIQQLENETIYDLLRIFISENFHSYLDFYKKHNDLITKHWKLDHEKNLRKMRQLTFMQLVEGCTEISFETISKELNLSETEVERFIIDVIKTKLVKARMDQFAKKVYVTSSMSRTFGLKQWQHLGDMLHIWRQNIDNVNESLVSLVHNNEGGAVENLLVF